MELWTGLVCLVPDPACRDFKRFGDGNGAYVNVVAWAESAKHFERRVTDIAKEQSNCIVREMEKVELLQSALEGENFRRRKCPRRILHHEIDSREAAKGRAIRGFPRLGARRCELILG